MTAHNRLFPSCSCHPNLMFCPGDSSLNNIMKMFKTEVTMMKMVANIKYTVTKDDPPYIFDLSKDNDGVYMQILVPKGTVNSPFVSDEPFLKGGDVIRVPEKFISEQVIGNVKVKQVMVDHSFFLDGLDEFVLTIMETTKHPVSV